MEQIVLEKPEICEIEIIATRVISNSMWASPEVLVRLSDGAEFWDSDISNDDYQVIRDQEVKGNLPQSAYCVL